MSPIAFFSVQKNTFFFHLELREETSTIFLPLKYAPDIFLNK